MVACILHLTASPCSISIIHNSAIRGREKKKQKKPLRTLHNQQMNEKTMNRVLLEQLVIVAVITQSLLI